MHCKRHTACSCCEIVQVFGAHAWVHRRRTSQHMPGQSCDQARSHDACLVLNTRSHQHAWRIRWESARSDCGVAAVSAAFAPRAAFSASAMASSDEDWLPAGIGVGGDNKAELDQSSSEEAWFSDEERGAGGAIVVADVGAAARGDRPPPAADLPRMSRADAAANARKARLAKAQERKLGEEAQQQALARAKAQEPTSTPGTAFAKMVLRAQRSKFSAFLKPAMAIAEECDIPRTHFSGYLWSYTCSLWRTARKRIGDMIEGLVCTAGEPSASAHDITPAVYVRMRKFDETSSIMACVWDHGHELLAGSEPLLDQEVGPTKVFVMELRHGLLMKKTSATTGESQHLTIFGDLPSPLFAVERNTAECYLEALRRGLKADWDAIVNERVSRQIDITVHDDHKSNSKAERAMSRDIGRPKLELLCDAHKLAAIPTKMFELWKELPTGCIRFALSVRGPGMAALRRAMRLVIKEKLVIHTGAPPIEALQYKQSVLGLFLNTGKPKDVYRKHVIESLFNGDWRNANEVQYFDHGEIEGGRRGVEKAMYLYGVRALLPRALRVLARNNWTGTGEALDGIGLAECVHGLLGASLLRMQSMQGAAHDLGEPPHAAAPLAVLDVAEDMVGDDEDWADLAGRAPTTKGGAAQGSEDHLKSVWKEERAQQLQCSQAWFASGFVATDLIVARALYSPQEVCMLQQLHVTGRLWELKQQALHAEGKKRTFRM